jgi:hypothetical protein
VRGDSSVWSDRNRGNDGTLSAFADKDSTDAGREYLDESAGMEKSGRPEDLPALGSLDSSEVRELPPVLRELVEQLCDASLEAGDPHPRVIASGVFTGGG